MTFLDQGSLCRILSGSTWIDVGGHDSSGWAGRKAAEVAHIQGCGLKCSPLCGAASELLGIAGVHARFRGDLIVPHEGRTLSLRDVLSLVTFGAGSSCGTIVVDDLGALLAQQPTPAWWQNFAEAADASTAETVTVVLLAATRDLVNWPEGLPRPAKVVQGKEWWLGSHWVDLD